MKHYTLHDAAQALGVEHETLQERLNQTHIQPAFDSEGQPVLDEEQLHQLAAQYSTLDLPNPTLNGNNAEPQADVPPVHPIVLDAPFVSLGRAPDNQIVLNHPQVSSHHARLERLQDGAYRIVDRRSTNHVYVNGKRVRSQTLNPDDQVTIGPFQFVYTGNELIQQGESESIRIDALHLKQSGKWLSLLLNDISLPIPARSFVALVGGSGVGKTTLLNALSGVAPARRGTVLYNGRDYYHSLDGFSTQIGYVPQDDIMHGRLTVAQALFYTARLRLPDDFTRGQIKERVDEVLEDVGLTHRRRHLVRSLSGGERKRVSIALELLAHPSVFFLDEPSAGVDPGLDLRMMQLLRALADKGHTVVLVTHATENIDLCDYVCFLASGGRMAFYGPPQEAKEYFGVSRFSEIYTALEPTPEDKDVAKDAEERFKQSSYYQRYVAEPLNQLLEVMPEEDDLPPVQFNLTRRANPWRQFSLLSRRYLHLLKNDFSNLILLLLQAPIIGAILFGLAGAGTFSPTSITTCPLREDPANNTGRIVSINCQKVVDLLNSPSGTAFAQQQHQSKQQLLQNAIEANSGADAQTLLFLMAFSAILFGCINGVREIVKEAPIYRRERMVNLGITPYIFSKIVILGILCLLQSAVIVAFVNQKAPLHQGIFLPILVEIFLTMALASLTGLMMGLLISSLAPNTDRAMSLVPLVLLPQVIFSGIIFKLDTPLLQTAGGLFAMRWAMAGMGSSVGLHGDKLGVDNFAYQGTHFATLDPAAALPGAILHLLTVWGVLTAMIVLLGMVIAVAQKRKDVRA